VKHERVVEYARMLLGPVRFADKETRAQAIHTLKCMLNEAHGLELKAARHPKPEHGDMAVINGSHAFNAVSLAKAGYLAPWKQKICKALGL
jgi:hypothetical protein